MQLVLVLIFCEGLSALLSPSLVSPRDAINFVVGLLVSLPMTAPSLSYFLDRKSLGLSFYLPLALKEKAPFSICHEMKHLIAYEYKYRLLSRFLDVSILFQFNKFFYVYFLQVLQSSKDCFLSRAARRSF